MFKRFSVVFNLWVVLSLVFSSSGLASGHPEIVIPHSSAEIFRTKVSLSDPTRRHRLDQLGVTILQESESWAILLAARDQQSTLAKLGYHPIESNELGTLVQAYAAQNPSLSGRLQSMLSQVATVANAEADSTNSTLLALIQSLTEEQKNWITSLAGLDSDGDGLNDTEESWWCTDPHDPNSDSPNPPSLNDPNDGDEVHGLMNGSRTYGAPFTLWPDFKPRNLNGTCQDGDSDSVPDNAEEMMLGLDKTNESTDGDKYDDGQELFGVTFCPQGAGACNYGALPRPIDTFLGAGLPTWILPPGDSPFVAAYPVIDFQVDPATIRVTAKEIKTIERTITQGEEISTGYAETEGKSTTVGTIDTNTHSTWQENSTTNGTISPGTIPSNNIPYSPLINSQIDPITSSNQLALSTPIPIRDVLPDDIVPGPIAVEAMINQKVAEALSNANNTNPRSENYSITSIRQEGNWRFISVAGLAHTNSNSNWNLENNLTWWGLVLLYQDETGKTESAVEGTRTFSTLLSSIPDTILSPIAKQALDPLQTQSNSGTPVFPWKPNKRMTFGSLGVHFAGYNGMNWGITDWAAIDLAGNTDDAEGTKEIFPALDSSVVGAVCEDTTNQTIAFKAGPFIYAHLHNNHNIQTGTVFSKGQKIGDLEVGAFPAGNCGYQLGQGPKDFHLHFGFANTGSLQIGGWALSWNKDSVSRNNRDIGAIWNRNSQKISVNHELWAENPSGDSCNVPKVTSTTLPSNPQINTQQKPSSFIEILGKKFSGWLGKLFHGNNSNLSSIEAASTNTWGCIGTTCQEQVSYLTNTPLNFSDNRTGGQCGGDPNSQPGTIEGFGGGDGASLATNNNGDGTFDALRIWMETTTNGEGWSTSHSELRSETTYKEITRSKTNTLVSSEAWSTATTVDPTDAATLTFNYSLHNKGSDLAVNLKNIDLNILIGDLPAITWRAPDRSNISPNQTVGPFSSDTLHLTLEQLAAIDNGAPIRVVLADYGYNDSLYDYDAWGRSVLFHVDDGLADGDRKVDTYLVAKVLPNETYQDTLARYFTISVFNGGPADTRTNTITNIRTPEFDNNGQITAWQDHPVGKNSWWELSISQGGETAGVAHFKDMPSKPKTDVYLNYIVDTDGDGYTDRAEQDAGSDPNNPQSHPRPLMIVGQHTNISGNSASVQLNLQNNGNFDASSVEVWAIAPDDTITISDNLIGGGGRVRAGSRVVLGARIGAPDLTHWVNGTTKPYLDGQFEGVSAKTFSFRADTAGTVGNTAGLTISWSSDSTNWAPLAVGTGYTAGNWLSVTDGVKIAFTPGTVAAGETFSVATALPIDTFSYTINTPSSYSKPLIVVSYNDAQGNHKFISDVELDEIQTDLTAYQGQMRFGVQLDALSSAKFAPGANTLKLTFYNPIEKTITAGKLFVEFARPDGTVVKEYVLSDQTFQPGPNQVSLAWNTSAFSPALDPAVDYHILAFAADRQGTIIENTVKALTQLGKDDLPIAGLSAQSWNFGTVTQGTVVNQEIGLSNTGLASLRAYYASSASLSKSGWLTVEPATFSTVYLTLDTASLPVGPFTSTLTLRTSDIAHPTLTINISGTIQALSGQALAYGADPYRPWDQLVYVPGPHDLNDAVVFDHSIPDPDGRISPLFVYSEDGGTLLGVGKDAAQFGGTGTIAFDMFGDGRDGIMPSGGNLDNNNGFGIGVVNNGGIGTYSISVTDAYGVSRINPGDIVLIHQTQGADVGCWELNRAVSDFGSGTATYQLTNPLKCNYTSGGNNHPQIIRVPQYTDCPVSGTVTPLDGMARGVVFLLWRVMEQ